MEFDGPRSESVRLWFDDTTLHYENNYGGPSTMLLKRAHRPHPSENKRVSDAGDVISADEKKTVRAQLPTGRVVRSAYYAPRDRLAAAVVPRNGKETIVLLDAGSGEQLQTWTSDTQSMNVDFTAEGAIRVIRQVGDVIRMETATRILSS